MPIVVECAECDGKFRAKDTLKDKEVPCPKCKKTLVVTGPRVPEYDVFLSHSSTDAAAANAICHALEEKRIRCWIAPRDIPPGKKWASAIVDGLAESRVLVLLLTEEAVLSPQVLNEIQQAAQQNLIIFPIRLKDVQLSSELSFFIGRSHWLDAFPPPLDEYLAGIVKSVRALLVDDPSSDSKVDFPQTRQTITSAPEKKSRRRFPLFPQLLLAGILGACFISWKLSGEPSVSKLLAMLQSDSQPGWIDFAKVTPGRLPEGWSGSNFVGVDLAGGAPALKLTQQQSKGNETVFLDDIRLGGDFFIELQILSANAQKISLELESTTGGQTLQIPLEMTRNNGWVISYEGVPFFGLEEVQRSYVPTWIRFEHTSEGLFVQANGDASRQKRIRDPKQALFDRLSISFPPGSNEREIQNLRWGPLEDQPIPATMKFDPPIKKGPNGLPQGWIRLAGQDGPVRQRIAAPNLVIGEQFAIDLEVQVKRGCEFTLNLIGAGDGPTLPISFYFDQWTFEVRALNGTNSLALDHDPVRIRIERDGDNFTVRSSAGANIFSFRSDAFESFDRMEFDLTSGADRLISFKPPTVKLP